MELIVLEELESDVEASVSCPETLHLIGRDSDSSIKSGLRSFGWCGRVCHPPLVISATKSTRSEEL